MRNLILLFLMLFSLKESLAGPLDNNSLTLLEYRLYGKKYTNTIKCQDLDRSLLDCDEIIFSENIISKKTGNARIIESHTLTKKQLIESLLEYTKEYRTLTIPLNATVFGISGCFALGRSTKLKEYFSIPCILLAGFPLGLSIDAASLPLYGGAFTYRALYKKIRVINNIKNLITNKKFKTIRPKRISVLEEVEINRLSLLYIVQEKARE